MTSGLQFRQTLIGEDPSKSDILTWAASSELVVRISFLGVPLMDVYQN